VSSIEILFTEADISNRLNELAIEVANDFPQIQLHLLGVLNGANPLLAYFGRALWKVGKQDSTVDTIGISSYGKRLKSNGKPRINKGIKLPVKGKHVLGIDDIADTRRTTRYLQQYLRMRGAASFQILALLSKTSMIEVEAPIKYIGFEIPNQFVFGYGIDVKEQERTRPYIAYIKN
jgi:hypoxanthine phosphoribosyltransferase